jgi:uncharacterized protein (DUF305 family)
VTSKTLVGTALAVLALGAALTACGDNASSGMTGRTSTTTSAAQQNDHNSADVAFAQQMIPHHQQALAMAKLVSGRTTNAKVTDLAGRIQKAQDPEIQQMTAWLNQWGAASNTSMGAMPGMSTSAMPGMGDGRPMPGMMSDADMAKLQTVKGGDFDAMWLQMMVQHHQGAIDMAKTELAQGSSTDTKTLAQKIIDGQQAEVTEMQGLLGQS